MLATSILIPLPFYNQKLPMHLYISPVHPCPPAEFASFTPALLSLPSASLTFEHPSLHNITTSLYQHMAKLPALFKRRAVARVPVPSPNSQHLHNTQSFLKLDDNSEFSSKNSSEISFNGDALSSLPDSKLIHSEESSSNRVMVVVDSSPEAKAALQWALSHTLQTQDTVILLHIFKPSSHHGADSNLIDHKAYELLYSMQNACQMRRPGMQVEIAARDGKEKAPIIVEEAKQRKVTLLVLGQKRRSIMGRLRKMWRGKRTRNRMVDYCIQNANCLTVAVRRKGRKHGGYLITTKRHKNFWLLA